MKNSWKDILILCLLFLFFAETYFLAKAKSKINALEQVYLSEKKSAKKLQLEKDIRPGEEKEETDGEYILRVKMEIDKFLFQREQRDVDEIREKKLLNDARCPFSEKS